MNTIVGVYRLKHRLGGDSSQVFVAENNEGKEVVLKELIVINLDNFRTEFKSITNKT